MKRTKELLDLYRKYRSRVVKKRLLLMSLIYSINMLSYYSLLILVLVCFNYYKKAHTVPEVFIFIAVLCVFSGFRYFFTYKRLALRKLITEHKLRSKIAKLAEKDIATLNKHKERGAKASELLSSF